MRLRGRRRGFSLVELLVALTIFTAGYLAVIGLFPTCARSVHQARVIMLATHVAQAHLENAINRANGAAVAESSGTEDVLSAVNGSTETLSFTWQVSATTLNASSGLQDVRCQVYCATLPAVGPTRVAPVVVETMVVRFP